MSTAVTLDRRECICDFCSDTNPVSVFHYEAVVCARISDLLDISSGTWRACETCAQLIEHENWRGLADRATEMICRKEEVPIGPKRITIRREVLELHSLFRRYRVAAQEFL
jgi:hypothetical protein